MDHLKQQNVLSLTPELWAKVFGLMEDKPEVIGHWDDTLETLAWQNQMELHQLKLVCKQFRQVYASHARLIQRLYLCNGFSARLLPGLLSWLQQNKSSIKTFQSAKARPFVDAVLAGLVSSEQRIKAADVYDVSTCSLSLLAAFTSLEKCALWHKSTDPLDLAPLGNLPKLNHLVLHGQFEELHCLTSLTRLECITADVSNVQDFAQSLQHLDIDDSQLLGMHTQAFSRCTALTHLGFKNASLVDSNEREYLDGDLSKTPTNIGLLRQLHTLHLSTSPDSVTLPDLEWISQLTSLENLSVACKHSYGRVLQDALLLTRLTHLDILGLRDFVGEMDVNIDWCRLPALQEVSICNHRLHLGQSVGWLLRLPHLRLISFAGSTQDDDECFAALMYGFARNRPQVKLIFDSGDLLHYFV